MRRILTIFICFFSIQLKAQDMPGVGDVTREELQMKECSFDKNATAVVLLHEAKADYNDDHNLITVHHIKIKILKDKGIANANVEIPFYRKDDFEYIDKIQGITINPLPSGETEKLPVDNKSIFTEKSTPYWGRMKFTFPSVKVGSILEYVYRSTMKHYGGLEVKDWYFQDEIPVLASKYEVVILPGAEFAYQVQKSPDYKIDIKSNRDDGRISFEMKNIPAFTDEPYMDAKEDYVQKVKFQLSGYSGNGYKQRYSTTWQELAREQFREEYFGGQLDKNLAGSEEFIKEMKLLGSPMQKMEEVYSYVKQHMSWNRMNTTHSIDGVKTAWAKRTGSSADINLILVNLLRAVDLDADPILVSERDHGKVNTSYPFLDQFNTVYAVVSVNNRNYYLDATNRYLPSRTTPYEILNTTGFIVDKKKPQLVEIKDEQFKYDERIVISAEVSAAGMLNGKVSVRSSDYARSIKVSGYKSDEGRFLETYFKKGTDGISIDSFKTTGEDIDTLPFVQEFKFKLPLNASGDYQFLNLHLFTGQQSDPFILDNRFTNINFGYKQRIMVASLVDIPETFVIDAMPKPIAFVTPDRSISFQRTITLAQGKLVQNMLIEVNKSLFDVDEYPMVKEFYKKMFDSLNEPVVLKKK